MEDMKHVLEDVLVAQILVLAAQIKADKAAGGIRTTSDCVNDAVRLLRQKQPEILRQLRQM